MAPRGTPCRSEFQSPLPQLHEHQSEASPPQTSGEFSTSQERQATHVSQRVTGQHQAAQATLGEDSRGILRLSKGKLIFSFVAEARQCPGSLPH